MLTNYFSYELAELLLTGFIGRLLIICCRFLWGARKAVKRALSSSMRVRVPSVNVTQAKRGRETGGNY
jgi:hypothetical protein